MTNMASCLEIGRQALCVKKTGVEGLIPVCRFDGKRIKATTRLVCLTHPTLARSTTHNS